MTNVASNRVQMWVAILMRGRLSPYTGGCWGSWVVISVCGQSFLCIGSLFWMWAIVPICGHSSSYMGGRLCTWVVIVNVGSRFWMWAIIFEHGQSASYVGGPWRWWGRCCAWGPCPVSQLGQNVERCAYRVLQEKMMMNNEFLSTIKASQCATIWTAGLVSAIQQQRQLHTTPKSQKWLPGYFLVD